MTDLEQRVRELERGKSGAGSLLLPLIFLIFLGLIAWGHFHPTEELRNCRAKGGTAVLDAPVLCLRPSALIPFDSLRAHP